MARFGSDNADKIANMVSFILEKNRMLLENIGHCIWEKPELAFKETFAHDFLTGTLKNLGFQVRKHILGTGFRAEFSCGEGPTVAVLCEYDALPEIGHACGHNLIAESGVATGLAVKYVLESSLGISGKIVVMGTPAEEGGGGKIKMLEVGAFDDIDVVVMAHPDTVTRTCPLMLATLRSEVWYVAETTDKKANSLDAAVACYGQVSLLRQRLSSQCRIMGIIEKSEMSGLNVPKKTGLRFLIRAPSNGALTALKKSVEACFISAARSMNCKVEYRFDPGYQSLMMNNTLTDIYRKHAEGFGVVFEDPKTLPVAISSDIGNVSHVVPSIHPIYKIGHGHVIHSRGFALLATTAEAQHAALLAAKSLAMTCLHVLGSSNALEDIRREFQQELEKDRLTCE